MVYSGVFIRSYDNPRCCLSKSIFFKNRSRSSLITMVLILDGTSEIGAQVESNHCYVFCLRHVIDWEHLQIDFFPAGVRNMF